MAFSDRGVPLKKHPMKRFISLLVLAASVLPAGAAEPPRAARSVHLGWQAPEAAAFYVEAVVEQTTPGSFFMAAGWDTGYFGLQELGNGKHVAIFSVWDPTAGDDPNAVRTEERVELLHEGPGVRIRRFGGEGTGGQCMTDFAWTVGGTNRFLVVGRPQDQKTAYEGHLYDPATKAWRHLVTFRTRTGGRPLRGLYSFVEDFRRDTRSVHDLRRARFGHGWVKPVAGGDWQPLLRARFTASGAEWEAKDNIDAGRAGAPGWFHLATGGDIRTNTPLRTLMEWTEQGAPLPEDVPGLLR